MTDEHKQKRTPQPKEDDVLRALLATPPQPFTPKVKKKTKKRRKAP